MKGEFSTDKEERKIIFLVIEGLKWIDLYGAPAASVHRRKKLIQYLKGFHFAMAS